ncbi:hypothetical protein SBRY_30884 [Actinacidiphila bryophytorum]|uniref:Uncharacterized protein n=1 Tax=Actinacidiphila bryophytorum TaxID=1436133 RepID=A0A9W4H200_9ACTN|nr:hypothetical protein SBRY_30884 [Actinacidiphila bryophytorum]
MERLGHGGSPRRRAADRPADLTGHRVRPRRHLRLHRRHPDDDHPTRPLGVADHRTRRRAGGRHVPLLVLELRDERTRRDRGRQQHRRHHGVGRRGDPRGRRRPVRRPPPHGVRPALTAGRSASGPIREVPDLTGDRGAKPLLGLGPRVFVIGARARRPEEFAQSFWKGALADLVITMQGHIVPRVWQARVHEPRCGWRRVLRGGAAGGWSWCRACDGRERDALRDSGGASGPLSASLPGGGAAGVS